MERRGKSEHFEFSEFHNERVAANVFGIQTASGKTQVCGRPRVAGVALWLAALAQRTARCSSCYFYTVFSLMLVAVIHSV